MRSCSPAALSSPRQADNFFFFFMGRQALDLEGLAFFF
jgi:hypothetical protein